MGSTARNNASASSQRMTLRFVLRAGRVSFSDDEPVAGGRTFEQKWLIPWYVKRYAALQTAEIR